MAWMESLLDSLLDAPLDNARSHLDCLLDACVSSLLLALSRCGWRLHIALAPSLKRTEQASEAVICARLGIKYTQLSATNVLTWKSGLLPSAQCWHLGAWLSVGGLLEGVTSLHVWHPEDDEEERVDELDLLQFRSDETCRIELSNSCIDDALLITLIHARSMANLEKLYLGRNQISDVGLAAFSHQFADDSLGALTKLYLGDNWIGDIGMAEFSRSIANGSMANLEVLDLRKNQVGDVGMAAFSRQIANGSVGALTHLYLDYNKIGDTGITVFCRSIACRSMANLRWLQLDNNSIGDAGIAEISRQIANGSLPAVKTVGLSGNSGDSAPVKLTLAIARSDVSRMDLESMTLTRVDEF